MRGLDDWLLKALLTPVMAHLAALPCRDSRMLPDCTEIAAVDVSVTDMTILPGLAKSPRKWPFLTKSGGNVTFPIERGLSTPLKCNANVKPM